ncbi:MAG: GatB/YqeY domain-containing protein [Anaerolineales bacterium]|nr:GatB/YqeY domain-containing protein [Anaerolineales bacterium]MCX7608318.1 GatB/YqeY domain-containing protein [Anaerolineales bacterium]MDW8227347.1 GatB/YqeY domain-containing protein [Anaerolineales bacterium]
MDTKAKLEQALKEAMKAGDDVTRRTVRMALAAIRQSEIDRQTTLDEAAVLNILQKEIKTRREAAEEARRANRPDLIAAAEAEIQVLQGFLPQALSADELNRLIQEVMAETGATSLADMGKVMKVLMPRVAGRLPGDQVSSAVRSMLQK